MLEWVKEHPYITGSLLVGVIVLYIVLRNSGTAAQSTQVVQSGPSDALQAADLQAQVQQQGIQAASNAQTDQLNAALAAKSIDAAVSTAQTQAQKDVASQQITAQQDVATQQINAQLQESQFGAISADKVTAAQVAIAGIQAGAQQSVAEAQINGQVQIAGIQADVQKLGITDQLAALLDTNKTNIGLATIGANQAISLATINATLESHVSDNQTNLGELQSNNSLAATLAQYNAAMNINQQNVTAQEYEANLGFQLGTTQSNNALTALLSNNTTSLNIATINAGVQTHGIDALSAVYNNLINTQGQIQLTTLANQNTDYLATLNAFSSVDFNRGGSGGANQVQAWSSFFGVPQPGSTSNPFASIPLDISTAFSGLKLLGI